MAFEPNRGQAEPGIEFLSRGDGYGLFLRGSEAVLAVRGHGTDSLVRMRLAGGSARTRGEGEDPLAGKSHYFLGNDPSRWHTNVPNYSRVRYRGVYPGIDVVYYGSQGQLEFDFLAEAGADTSLIRLQFRGAQRLRLNSDGDVRIETAAGEMRLHRPRVFQDGATVQAQYTLGKNRTLALRLGAHDRTRPLRIDPVLVYSTYLGGDSAVTGGSDYGRALAVDASGYIYVAGSSESPKFPVTKDAAQVKLGGGVDAFVIKLDPTGACLYATYLGGEFQDDALAVAVDMAGNAYVTGTTQSRKFPVTKGALQTIMGGYANAFVTKLDPAGAVVYSTLLGGEVNDWASAIAVNGAGEAFVAGTATSATFPVTDGALQTVRKTAQTAFVAKLDATGSSLLYSTYLGGSSSDGAAAIAVDADGNAYVAGQTGSRDFPVTPGAYRRSVSLRDAFVAKLNAAGSALEYATLLGGQSDDAATAIAIDGSGGAYVGGTTSTQNLPVTKDAQQAKYGGGTSDGFLAKLDAKGAALLYLSYLGGSGRDAVNGVAVAFDGGVYIAGETQSKDFPVPEGALQATYGGGPSDGFLVKLNGADLTRSFATYWGGEAEDRITAAAVDSSGGPLVAGYTASSSLTTTPGALQPGLAPGGFDAFVTQMDSQGTAAVLSTYLGGSGASTDERAVDIVVDVSGAAYVTGQTFSTNFPVTGGGVQPARGGGIFGDAFVVKVAPDGRSLMYATYLCGSGDDSGAGIALDSAGNAYVTGTTSSADFPVSETAFQKTIKGGSDVFAAKLSADGSQLVYSTLIGGTSTDLAAGIAIDSGGNAYVAGNTYSQNFPVSQGAVKTSYSGAMDAFVAQFNADGSALVYSTLLGGQLYTTATSIAVDQDRNAYVTGHTSSKDFPTTPGALQTALAGTSDAFVTKFDPSGTSLRYSTLLGGSGGETARRIVVDASGNAYVAGTTGSSDFPATKGSYQTSAAGGGDAYVAKLKPDGGSLEYATYIGGPSSEEALGLAVDAGGVAYAGGTTSSFVFPSTPGRFQTGLVGFPDAFLCVVSADGKTLQFSSQFGFSGGRTTGYGLALDASGKVYMAGQTSSAAFRTTPGALQRVPGSAVTGFVTKFDLAGVAPVPVIARAYNYVTGNPTVAGGGVITIEGQNLAEESIEFAKPLDKLTGPLPTRLGATVAKFGPDRTMPLYSVSPAKIVAQLPYVALDTIDFITVTVNAETSNRVNPQQAGTAFGLLAVYREDNAVLNQSNPVKPGDTITVLVTGFGRTNPSVATGAPAPADPLVSVRYDNYNPYVTIEQTGYSTMKCDVTSMTLVPGTVGIAQAKVRIGPVSSDNDRWELVFLSGNAPSNKVPVWIKSAAN
jgi:uncharacterized protein (TIGR03437 family)